MTLVRPDGTCDWCGGITGGPSDDFSCFCEFCTVCHEPIIGLSGWIKHPECEAREEEYWEPDDYPVGDPDERRLGRRIQDVDAGGVL